MSESEIEIIKKCAALIASRYDSTEPWISPNTILSSFELPKWELCEGYWLDNETGVNYHFS